MIKQSINSQLFSTFARFFSKMKRIVSIQDISCVGKCSLKVALPLISAMGIETCIIPTAVLSTHTGFKDYTFVDLTNEIRPIWEHWQQENIQFDAIYTGYLGSIYQIDLMLEFIDNFSHANTIKIIDPCMGDNGNFYKGFGQQYAQSMLTLCSKADIIVPNMTEASFLLDIPYQSMGYQWTDIQNILVKLSQLGAKKVVLKGVEFQHEPAEIPSCKGKIGIVSYDSTTNMFDYYFHEKQPRSFVGTGDIFASILTGAIVRGISLKDSYTLAGDFIVEAIKATIKRENSNWYGVDFETAIPYLVNRLQNLIK